MTKYRYRDALVEVVRLLSARTGAPDEETTVIEAVCASSKPREIVQQAAALIENLGPIKSPLLLPAHIRMSPQLFPDGNMWCMLYGANISEGVCGFGKTPAEAAANFDENWGNQVLPKKLSAAFDVVGGQTRND